MRNGPLVLALISLVFVAGCAGKSKTNSKNGLTRSEIQKAAPQLIFSELSKCVSGFGRKLSASIKVSGQFYCDEKGCDVEGVSSEGVSAENVLELKAVDQCGLVIQEKARKLCREKGIRLASGKFKFEASSR